MHGATQFGIHVWTFLNAPTSYQRVHDYFAQQLPRNGCGCVHDRSDSGALSDVPMVTALGLFEGIQAGQVLSIAFASDTVTASGPQPSDT
jgi:hypothetical protein